MLEVKPSTAVNRVPVTTELLQSGEHLPIYHDFRLAVSRGEISGIRHFNVEGRTHNGGNALTLDVWDRANSTDAEYVFIPPDYAIAEYRVELKSTSASDTSLGSAGARSVTVRGMTTAGVYDEETIAMNGVSWSLPSTKDFMLIYEMEVNEWGPAASTPNVGDIVCRRKDDPNNMCQIQAGEGRSHSAFLPIAQNTEVYLTNIYADVVETSVNAGNFDNVTISLFFNDGIDNAVSLRKFRTKNYIRPSLGINNRTFNPYEKILEGNSNIGFIKMQAEIQTEAALNDHQLEIIAGFQVILVDVTP